MNVRGAREALQAAIAMTPLLDLADAELAQLIATV
jgi:hypothetical protein